MKKKGYISRTCYGSKGFRALYMIGCFLLPFTMHSQVKTLYGSYILNGEVYTYQFTESRNGYSLKLSTLEDTYQAPQFDSAKLALTIEQIEQNKEKDTSKLLTRLSGIVNQLKQLNNLSPVWKSSHKELKAVMEKISADTIRKRVDSTIAIGAKGDKPYQVQELLQPYSAFLERMNDPKESKTKAFPEMKVQEFALEFRQSMAELEPEKYTLNKKGDSTLQKRGEQIFYEILTRMKFEDDEPITAYAILKRKFVIVYSDEEENDSIRCEVERIQLEFEDGTIKNIVAELVPLDSDYSANYGRQPLSFRNSMPISVSGKFDPERFTRYYIPLKNSRGPKLYIGKKDLTNAYFKLNEVLDYRIMLENNKEDYSPVNQVVELSRINPEQELRKEKASKLFDARAYTDVVGFNDDQPNGLVQIEISRKVNLITTRLPRFRLLPFFELKKKCWIRKLNKPYNYTGFLTNFEVKAAYNKIEQNNRYYSVDGSFIDTSRSFEHMDTRLRLNPLDVMRYRKWTVGVDMNIYRVAIAELKTTFLFNGSFLSGQTQIKDSLGINPADTTIIKTPYQNISAVNWSSYGFSVALEFKPDSRYNFLFYYSWRWINTFHPRHDLESQYGRQFRMTGLSGFRKLSSTSEVFFRYNRFWQNDNPKNNFDQIQIGYQLNLFTGTKSDAVSK